MEEDFCVEAKALKEKDSGKGDTQKNHLKNM